MKPARSSALTAASRSRRQDPWPSARAPRKAYGGKEGPPQPGRGALQRASPPPKASGPRLQRVPRLAPAPSAVASRAQCSRSAPIVAGGSLRRARALLARGAAPPCKPEPSSARRAAGAHRGQAFSPQRFPHHANGARSSRHCGPALRAQDDGHVGSPTTLSSHRCILRSPGRATCSWCATWAAVTVRGCS